MLVNDVINAITVELHDKFGDGYTYYREDVEQNVRKPSFLVRALNPMARVFNQWVIEWTVPMTIHYFTGKENTFDANQDCLDIAENLFTRLNVLDREGKPWLRGKDISWEIVEGVLQFFITYNCYTEKDYEIIYMEEGTLNGYRM